MKDGEIRIEMDKFGVEALMQLRGKKVEITPYDALHKIAVHAGKLNTVYSLGCDTTGTEHPTLETQDAVHNVDAFLAAVTELCRKHRVSIGQEKDSEFSFIIYMHPTSEQAEADCRWLNAASARTCV